MNAEYQDGWFHGYAPTEEYEFVSDAEHRVRVVDSKNVVGRFRDHDVIDKPASKAARKSMYRTGIVLESRSLRTANGAGSDVAGQLIRFDQAYVQASLAAIQRFPEAWAAYQKKRKAQVTEDERQALAEIGLAPKEKPERKRKVKSETPAENVVALQKASA